MRPTDRVGPAMVAPLSPDVAGDLGPAGRALRVVIAEDEALIRLDLKESLIDEGYEVVGEAGDGAEAIRLVESLRPDVAILDIKMPGTDGLVAAAEIAEQRLCAVVILTAFSQRELIDSARTAGALAYVVKPFHRNELVPAIELAIARYSEMTELLVANQQLADKLESRKLIDRAKGRLMDNNGLSESDAFRFIQKKAMSERVSMAAVSAEILGGDSES